MGVSRRGQQAWGLPLPLEGATNNTQIGTLGTGTPNRYRKLSPQLREGEIPRPPSSTSLCLFRLLLRLIWCVWSA